MTLDEIKALAVPAADDCVLFLWSTAPMRRHALEVMQAGGFQHRTEVVWVKDRIGTGYWFRNQHETLMVGVRGKVPAPAPGTQCPSVIEAPVGRHSEKPETFAEMIERYFPTVPRLELFARRRRPGWDVWGAEV
jgi:N6-adenosine-specific RNA methylase IME4